MERPRRQARSLQSVFFRNTRLSDSAFSSVAFSTYEPLISTAAWNRPLASGDVIKVHTEVPPPSVRGNTQEAAVHLNEIHFCSTYTLKMWLWIEGNSTFVPFIMVNQVLAFLSSLLNFASLALQHLSVLRSITITWKSKYHHDVLKTLVWKRKVAAVSHDSTSLVIRGQFQVFFF